MEDPQIFHDSTPHGVFSHKMYHLLETDLFTFAHFPKKSLACESGSLDHLDPQHRNFNQVAPHRAWSPDQVAQIFADSRPNVSTLDR